MKSLEAIITVDEDSNASNESEYVSIKTVIPISMSLGSIDNVLNHNESKSKKNEEIITIDDDDTTRLKNFSTTNFNKDCRKPRFGPRKPITINNSSKNPKVQKKDFCDEYSEEIFKVFLNPECAESQNLRYEEYSKINFI